MKSHGLPMGLARAGWRVRAMAGLAVVLGLGGGALGQCDWMIAGVPDFDQKRADTPSIPGLPGDGVAYCVPTAASTWMAYLANHGYPALLGGVHNWQSAGVYDLVTSRIALMGQLIGTDPVNGSDLGGLQRGLTTYLFAFEPGKFDVTTAGTSTGYIPSPADMWLAHQLGALVQQHWAKFTESPAGFFTRASGHATTLVGMTGFCGGTATVRFNTASDDPINTTQSPFQYAHSELVPVGAWFRQKVNLPYVLHAEYRFAQADVPVFLSGYGAIWPVFGITTGNSGGGSGPPELRIQRPVRILGNLPAVQAFQTPTGGVIRDVAMHPRLASYYYITGPVGSTPARVFRLDPIGGGSTEVTGFGAPTRLYFSRHGEMYVLDGATLFWIAPEGPPGSVGHGGSAASMGIDCVTYADSDDVVVGMDIAGRNVYVWARDLSGAPGTLPLPGAVCLSGRSSMTVSPVDGSLWVCSAGCPTIYKLVGTPLAVGDMINLPAGSNPTGLNVNRAGRVLFSSGGVLHEMERVGGAWMDAAGSDFAGIAAGAVFSLSRSRTNYDPATMSGPEWHDLPDPPGMPETPYCAGDYNLDGVRNSQDFFDFLADFFALDARADFNWDGGINSQDFFDFLTAFFAGCG